MSDGRFLTSYLPNCQLNRKLGKLFDSKPLTSWEYTYYLTNEAGKVKNHMNQVTNKIMDVLLIHTK